MPDDSLVPHPLAVAAAWAWRLLAIAAGLALAVYVFIRLRVVFTPVVIALFLSTLLVPPANWLRRHRVRPALATAVVFVVGLGVVGGLVAVIAPGVVRQTASVDDLLRKGTEDALSWLAHGPLGLSRVQIDRFLDQTGQRLRENANQIARGVVQGALTAAEVIAGLLLTAVLTFFFVKDGRRIGESALLLFPERHRVHLREAGSRSWTALGAYLRGIAVIASVDALAVGTGLAIIGVPLVLPLAILVFFGAFLPLIGAFIAGTVAALVALVTGGVVKALFVVALILAVQQLEGHILTPLVLGRATQLHPVVVILALAAGAVLGGIGGAFLAVPLAAVAAAILAYVRSLESRSGAS